MAVDERIKAQKSAARLMAGGKFLEALPLLKSALVTYGPHISIVMDIPACYYMIGDYVQFERYTLKAEAEFEEIGPFLSSESFVRSALTLGRLQEELGQFVKALSLYEKAAAVEDQDLPLIFNVYAQRLRLKAFLGIRKDFEKDYRICEKALMSSSSGSAADPRSAFALMHALVLADLFLGDVVSAQARLSKTLQLANPVEKRLVLFDAIAEILSQSSVKNLAAAVELMELALALEFADCDAFEQSIWKLLNGTCDLERTSEMSLIGSLKFAYLAQKFANSRFEKASATTKWFLLLHGLSSENRGYLELRCPVPPASRELLISKIGNQVQIEFANRNAVFDPEAFVIQLLGLFMKKNSSELSADVVCESIYFEALNISSADRLRRAIARANLDLAKKLGLDTPFILRKGQLRCSLSLHEEKP